MGTNFYHVSEQKPACECCKRPYEQERLHIGKSSAGWAFDLHVIPELNINTLEDWVERWKTPGTFIEDEYGAWVAPGEMLSRITNRATSNPRGLSRGAIDGYCIGHGPGPYDYIIGDFS